MNLGNWKLSSLRAFPCTLAGRSAEFELYIKRSARRDDHPDVVYVHLLWLGHPTGNLHWYLLRLLVLLYIHEHEPGPDSAATGKRQAEPSVDPAPTSTLHIIHVKLSNTHRNHIQQQ